MRIRLNRWALSSITRIRLVTGHPLQSRHSASSAPLNGTGDAAARATRDRQIQINGISCHKLRLRRASAYSIPCGEETANNTNLFLLSRKAFAIAQRPKQAACCMAARVLVEWNGDRQASVSYNGDTRHSDGRRSTHEHTLSTKPLWATRRF